MSRSLSATSTRVGEFGEGVQGCQSGFGLTVRAFAVKVRARLHTMYIHDIQHTCARADMTHPSSAATRARASPATPRRDNSGVNTTAQSLQDEQVLPNLLVRPTVRLQAPDPAPIAPWCLSPQPTCLRYSHLSRPISAPDGRDGGWLPTTPAPAFEGCTKVGAVLWSCRA